MKMKRCILTLATLSFVVSTARAVDVYTYDNNSLDGQWQENSYSGTTEYRFNGMNGDMNARWNNNDRNEFWVLRFDLAGVGKSDLGTISLTLTAMRTGSISKDLRIWGVNAGAEGLNTFDESADPADVPGFAELDFNPLTQSIDSGATTFLGDFQFPDKYPDADDDADEGDRLVIDQNLINNTGPNSMSGEGESVEGTLQSYIRGLGLNDMPMFIVGGMGSNGQVRVGASESTDTPSGTGIDPAPWMTYEVLQGTPGNFDGVDGVNGADFLAWQQGFPGMYDEADLGDWNDNYGTPAAVATIGVVPEPRTLALTLGGLLMLCVSGAVGSGRGTGK